MKGASLRSVAELLGHRGLRMVMRYAHLSPEHLSAEVGLLDPTTAPPPAPKETGLELEKRLLRLRVRRTERKRPIRPRYAAGSRSMKSKKGRAAPAR